MLRFLAALVLALPAVAQFPSLGLYAPRQRPPVLQLAQSSTTTIPIAQAHAIVARVGNGPALPDASSCRVTERVVEWDEARLNAPADHTPTAIRVEACVPVSVHYLMEALGGFLPQTVTTTGAAIEVQGALDPSFGVPVFDVIVPLPDLMSVRFPPFDGADDFAGSSGGIDLLTGALFQSNEFSVAQFGAFFEQQPGWTMLLRARIVESTLHTQTGGNNLHFTRVWSAAAGVVTTYDP